ncbi:MAG TPA: transcriptional regulator, partial [Dehalococcoidales bacterium]|nr:transcriptional regulator [Dehalococcoidales bacterium]
MERLKKADRMLKIWFLLRENPLRYTTRDLAEKFEVNVRSIYRDLVTLGNELNVPVYQDRGKWAIDKSCYLPPVRFTVPEALNILLAARLMLRYSHRYDPNVDLTFSLLASVLPGALKDEVQKTLDWMRKLPRNEVYFSVLAKLAEAWNNQRRVRITYRSLPAPKPTKRTIEPYSIEPAAAGHSSYVLAYCHQARELRVFKIERIEAIELTDEKYTIPADFNSNRYFRGAWGIVVEDKVQIVKLKFISDITRLMEEAIWHPSQVLEKQRDGSVIMTLTVFYTYELVTWILGWGEKVEVLEPPELREEVLQTARAMAKIYQK